MIFKFSTSPILELQKLFFSTSIECKNSTYWSTESYLFREISPWYMCSSAVLLFLGIRTFFLILQVEQNNNIPMKA